MTASQLCISVGGAPKGQPRGRHVPAGKGKVRVVSTADPKIAAYRTRLIAIMKDEAKRQGWKPPKLVRVDIVAYFATKDAERWGHYCGKKPDRDNIDKLVLDCAGAKNGAKLFKDDACVATGSVMKLWSGLAGIQIELTSLDGVMPQQDDDDDLGALKPVLGPDGKPFGLSKFLLDQPEPEGTVGGIDRDPLPIWRRIH